MMYVFEMVAIIAVVAIIASTISKYFENRNKGPGSEELERLKEQLGRLDNLERRVQTLEKIITDNKYDLHQKFKELEDA